MESKIINPSIHSIQEIYATLMALYRIKAIDGFNIDMTMKGSIEINIYEHNFDTVFRFEIKPTDSAEGKNTHEDLMSFLQDKYNEFKTEIQNKISHLEEEISLYNFLKEKYNG